MRNTILPLILFAELFLFQFARAQTPAVYKIADLERRISSRDTLYIVNFWATWCKPCVKELPSFDSLHAENAGKKRKVLLVSLDFREDLEKKLVPFLEKKNIRAECVLLDETNGNDFINRIDKDWSGAIPATLFKKGKKTYFRENTFNLNALRSLSDKTGHISR
jgi:thiol-disulfide isomerase/thioredoxin